VKPSVKFIFRLVVSGLLLVFFGFWVEWGEVFEAIGNVRLSTYLFSTLIGVMGSVCLAAKYSVLIKNTSLDIPLFRLLLINFISRFYALFLPSAIGPEAVRWYKVTRKKEGKSFFLAATLTERAVFLMILISCGTVPFFLVDYPSITKLREQFSPLLVIGWLLTVFCLLYFFSPAVQSLGRNILRKILPQARSGKLKKFLDNFSLRNLSASLFFWIVFWSIAWQLLFIFRVYFLFKAMGLPLSILDAMWMGSLVLLLQLLPITFAGLGVREGAYAYLFVIRNLPSEQGVLMGLLFFSQMLIFSGVGGILELSRR
jgi:glycosyltransferase 2 family protein